MATVELHIMEPSDGFVRLGSGEVQFRGEIVKIPAELAGIQLYYRWYSSLFASEQDRYSMNVIALTSPETVYTTSLDVGTHVIALGVSDRPGETTADFEATQHGGIAGGAEGETRCVIHVFEANLIAPLNGASVNRGAARLEAEAPAKWGQPIPDTDPPQYEPNEGYHEVNRVQYRWQFEPAGAPAGRARGELFGTPDNLIFDPEVTPPVVRYQGALPMALDSGAYRLTLHVEDVDGELGADQSVIDIVLT